MPIVTNQDGTIPLEGAAFPSPDGWGTLPPGLSGLPGVESYGSSKNATGEAWYIVVGSPAWRVYLAGLNPRPPVQGRGSDRGGYISVAIRPATVEFSTVPAVSAPTGEGDAVPAEYTNDPDLGVVPVGVPTNQNTAARIFSAPARFVSRLLPYNGAVPENVAVAVMSVPWILLGVGAWWLYRRMKR